MITEPGTPLASEVAVLEAEAPWALPRPRFEPVSDLHKELRSRVAEHFAARGVSRRGSWRYWTKAALTMLWWATTWSLLVFWASSWATAIPLAVMLGLAMCSIGFNIQHDGGHGASSERSGWNRFAAFGLDFLGASSYVWNWKHNHLHHQYTNVEGLDDDVNAGGLIRMAPTQPRRFFHRFQAAYAWVLYAFLGVKWQILDDFLDVIRGRIGSQPIPRPRGWELAGFLGGKAFSFTWALGIPLMVRPEPVWVVLVLYFVAFGTLGVVLATVFQLAHVLCESSFTTTRDGPDMGQPWAEHQLRTTCDFCPTNPLITAYVGGLNFQIEHHLFPRVSHEHYPQIAKIVRGVCEERGVRYVCHDSLLGAIWSHIKWLHRMGQPTS